MTTREFVVGGEDLDRALEEVLLRIRETEQKRKEIASLLLPLKEQPLPQELAGEALENSFILKVRRIEKLESRIAAVDSGFLGEELHTLDLMMVRAVAVIFQYDGGTELEGVEYYPNPVPSAKLLCSMEPMDSFEFETLTSIERLSAELRMAIETARKYRPDLLLLDGSLLPRYFDPANLRGEVAAKLHALLQQYRELYSLCAETGVMLAGVVKDCRSNYLLKSLLRVLPRLGIKFSPEDEEFLKHLRDTVFLDSLLSVGERTFSFKCSDEFPLYAFYLKSVPEDRPLRIEFLGGAGTAVRVAELVYAISAHHPSFAVPAPLVEADLRAHLFKEELELVHETLVDRMGFTSLLDLRRERRPF
ncbi:MAG: DNA double-strand break repair nuclease NurA [Candidatus Hadarchaeales archaeon]